jgi:hypothetical protein
VKGAWLCLSHAHLFAFTCTSLHVTRSQPVLPIRLNLHQPFCSTNTPKLRFDKQHHLTTRTLARRGRLATMAPTQVTHRGTYRTLQDSYKVLHQLARKYSARLLQARRYRRRAAK